MIVVLLICLYVYIHIYICSYVYAHILNEHDHCSKYMYTMKANLSVDIETCEMKHERCVCTYVHTYIQLVFCLLQQAL